MVMDFTQLAYKEKDIELICELLQKEGFRTGSNYFFEEEGSDDDWVIESESIKKLFEKIHLEYNPSNYLDSEKYKFKFLNIKIKRNKTKTIDIVIVDKKEKIIWKKSTNLMKKMIDENVIFKNICKHKINRVFFFELFKNFFRGNSREKYTASMKEFMMQFRNTIEEFYDNDF